jgi:uncharacterized membrane protein YgcG
VAVISRRVARTILLGLAALMMVMLAVSPALAGTSPAGIVNDEAGVLTADQLAAMDKALSGLQYQYRVVILDHAFDGAAPANDTAQFDQMLERFLTERQVPQDGVLIAVAMKERLVGFRVWQNGAVNQKFRDGTGRDFGAFTDQMIAAFRGPAAAGNIAEGVLSSARTIEGLVAANPVRPSSSTPSSPAPYTPGPIQPSPAPYTGYNGAPTPSRPAPTPIDWAPVGWTALGLAGAAAIVVWLMQLRAYRRRRREALAVRDSFLGELLHLMEKELPMARAYEGEATKAQVAAAVAAADMALKVEQEAEETRTQAERSARFCLLPRASRTLQQALEQYQAGKQAFAQASQAWEPVGFALRHWAEVSDVAGQNSGKAASGLSAEKVRTSWPLSALAGRIDEAVVTMDQGRKIRDRDPVQAVTLVKSADESFQAALSDLAAIPEVTARLGTEKTGRQQAGGAVDEARRTLGLRFVELSPDDSLAAALRHEETAALALPQGDVGTVRSELDAEAAAVAQALQILERYREALKQYPLKSASLSQDLAGLPAEQTSAAATLAGLATRFAAEDWADVASLAQDMSAFHAEGRSGLEDVTRLTSPAEQRYLRAVELLDGWLARREELRKAYGVLNARPGELEELCRQAQQHAEEMEALLEQAADQTYREGLRLPADLAGRLDEARAQLASIQALGRTSPVPAHRWERSAADGASLAGGLRDQVAEVARRASMARGELARAQQMAMAALAYEPYDRHGHAGTLRGALTAAQVALSGGNYDMALAECARAMTSCNGLEEAYRHHLREQEEEERRRREAMQSHSSGGSGSWGSSSNSGSGGSGSFGGGSSSGSGGSGHW